MKGKNIVVVQGHPDPDPARLSDGIAQAYMSGAEAGGHKAELFRIADLNYAMLRSHHDFYETPVPSALKPVTHALQTCDHFVIVFPLWAGNLPAYTHAFVEHLFGHGTGIDASGEGFPEGKLKGKSARVIVTMGMPAFAYRWIFGAHGVRSFAGLGLKFVGIKPVRTSYFGGMGNLGPKRAAKLLGKVEALGRNAR